MTRLFGAVAMMLALVLAACGGESSDPLASGDLAGMDADYLAINVEEIISTSGIRRAVLLGDTAYVYEDSGLTEIINVRVTLSGERGESTGSLTSDFGQRDVNTEAMMARGNVVLITEDGRRVETEELHYDPEADRVWSDVATTLYDGDATIHGTGFTSDANLQRIHVQNPTGRAEGIEIER